MTDNELLPALSNMLEEKLSPIKESITRLEIVGENEILSRLQKIESCYTSTMPEVLRRYKTRTLVTNVRREL